MKNKYVIIIIKIIAVLLTVVLLAAFAALAAIFVLVKGPSPIAKRYFVLSVKETSAIGFLADIFLSEDEVNEILTAQQQAIKGNDSTTNSSLVEIPTVIAEERESGEKDANAGISIIPIKRSNCNGVLMVVNDPKRIVLGKPEEYGYNKDGISLRQMIEKAGAIGGINGGGFYDPSGNGTGGVPEGIVIYDYELLWGDIEAQYNIIGFDSDGILHVGNMTGQAALEKHIKYACSFGPSLIINGVPSNRYHELGGGLNPRTAIGQRADGAVLLLVINGRSIGSLGATYDDLVSIMLENGAINASNLDGGSSSLLMYNGEFLNESASVIGERSLSTAFLIMP